MVVRCFPMEKRMMVWAKWFGGASGDEESDSLVDYKLGSMNVGYLFDYVCSAKSRSSGTRSSFLRITPVANTDTKLLINGLFQKGRVLAQDGLDAVFPQNICDGAPGYSMT